MPRSPKTIVEARTQQILQCIIEGNRTIKEIAYDTGYTVNYCRRVVNNILGYRMMLVSQKERRRIHNTRCMAKNRLRKGEPTPNRAAA